MQWEFLVALLLAIPIVLIPVVFVWYLNVGGVYTAIKEGREKQTVRGKGVKVVPVDGDR